MTQQLTPDLRKQLEEILARFESAWQRGERPAVDAYLPTEASLRLPVLQELIHTDLEYDWKAGLGTRVESYLERFPELHDHDEFLVELVAAEWQHRARHERVSRAEYESRFPKHAARLAQVLDDLAGNEPTNSYLAAGAVAGPEASQEAGRTRTYQGRKDASEQELAAPDQVDESGPAGYEILKLLGRGGMGVVYLARQTALKRLVALKMIRRGERHGKQELVRFRIEAEAIARLQHANIVQVYDIGEQAGQPFFSMEYVEGGSLDKKLAHKPQAPRDAAQMVRQLAEAMDAVHQAGIVHRDLKPANVLLMKDGTPKITDFGLAKRLDDDSGETRTGAVMGTPSYMAPEQALGLTEAVGPLVDVYALGAILYEMLTGRPPFRGASIYDIIDQIKQAEPVPPRRQQPRVPRDLETICLRCLHKEPARRYASAAALADDLRRFLEGETILARPAGLWERGLKFARRKPWIVAAWAATAALVLSLFGGGGYYLYRRNLDLTAELKKRDELDQKRGQATLLLLTGTEAMRQSDWLKAEAAAKEALALVGSEPGLEDLRTRGTNLQADAVNARQFIERCDAAFYHDMLAQEVGDPEKHLQASRAAATEAAALFDLAGPAPAFAGCRLPDEVAVRFKEEGYQLLLSWAHAAALAPGQTAAQKRDCASQALRILDRAPALGLETRAYHQRRAELLTTLDDTAGAERARQQALTTPLRTALDFFLLGLEANRRGDQEMAVSQLRKALELQADYFWASYYLAASYLKMRNPGAALEPLTDCTRLKPGFAWPYILRGMAHGELRDFQGAFADFARAEKANPDPLARYGILVNRGVYRVHDGKLDEAIADFEQATALRPDQAQAYGNLADAYLRLGRPEAALPHLDKAIGLQPTAGLYRTRAGLHLKRGEYARALADLEEAIRRQPLRASRELAVDHQERGRLLFRDKKYADALAAFDTALTVFPGLQQTQQLRGEALIELKRYAEAVDALDRFLAQGAPTAAAHRARALARAKLKDFTGAIEDYSSALDIDRLKKKSPDPATLAYRGWAYLISEAPRLALNDFEAALAQAGVDRVDCLSGRGYARVLLGDWKLGVADAEAALKDKPVQPRDLYNLGRIYAQAAGKVDVDPMKRDPQAQEQRRQFETKALQLVRTACEKTAADQRAAFWKEYVRTDPAFQPLRRNPAFAQLAADFGR
jgi:serine/threonine protein kinase/Tfp pilus assembly protein PilF